MVRNLNPALFHWALGGKDITGGIEQNPQELSELLDFIEKNHIKTYLEIGIAKGGLLRFMQDELKLQCTGITLDKRDTHEGLNVIYGKSQDKEVIKKVGFYDMIFVDGDHSFDAVEKDWRNYLPKCRYMAFHDICGYRDCAGVQELWFLIKDLYPSWTFKADNKEQRSGIGIIKIAK